MRPATAVAAVSRRSGTDVSPGLVAPGVLHQLPHRHLERRRAGRGTKGSRGRGSPRTIRSVSAGARGAWIIGLTTLVCASACSDAAPLDLDLVDHDRRVPSATAAVWQHVGGGSPAGRRAAAILAAQQRGGAAFAFELLDPGAVARAANPAQRTRLALDEGALVVEPRSMTAAWTLRLHYAGSGCRDRSRPTAPNARALGIDGSRASCTFADGVRQWLLNGPLGIEQGFVVERPARAVGPPGDRPLRLTIRVGGSLVPELGRGGSFVGLRDAAGLPVLQYGELFAYDAAGDELASHFAVRGQTIEIVVDDEGAQYPVTIDPLIWSEVGKLVASDGLDLDWLGRAVAVSGDTAVVGAWRDSGDPAGLGVAYVFERVSADPEIWQEKAKLVPSDSAEGDDFGYSVGVSGSTAIVGAYREDGAGSDRGAAYLFERDAGGTDAWGQVAKLTGSDSVDFDIFGWSMGIGGDTAVVGSYRNANGGSGRGAVYVFERDAGDPGAWGEVAKLAPDDLADQDRFGSAVAIDGDTAAVGAMFADAGGLDRGAVYLFERDAGGSDGWGEVAVLTADDGEDGDGFGSAVGLSASTAIVGAHYADGAGVDRGAAYLFERDSTEPDSWAQMATLTAGDGGDGDWFGADVAVSGVTAVAGARYHGAGDSERGAAYVFERNSGGGNGWGEVAKLIAADAEDGDLFGWAVGLDGDALIVGAPRQDVGGINRGAAYVFGLRKALGDSCAAAGECASGFCVDGVCCESQCGDGALLDCLGCSVAAGADEDGRCALLDGTSCDDGRFCTVSDRCETGSCVGQGDPCSGPDGDADCAESCDEGADACTGADPDGTPCPDGICLSGECDAFGSGGGAAAGGAAPSSPGQDIIVHGCGCRVGHPPSRHNVLWLAFLAVGLGRRRAHSGRGRPCGLSARPLAAVRPPRRSGSRAMNRRIDLRWGMVCRAAIGVGVCLALFAGCHLAGGLSDLEYSDSTTTETTATGTATATAAGGGGYGATGGAAAGGVGGTGGSVAGGGMGGGGVPALSDDGLVVRYFIDEAASGMVAQLEDSASDPLPLAITQGPEMAFTELGGHRALAWDAVGQNGRASVAVDGTKVYQALQGATQATIELVVDLRQATSLWSRIFHIGLDAEGGLFTLLSTDQNRLMFRLNDVERGIWPVGLSSAGRIVVHCVLDTTLAPAADRVRLYVDGSPVASTSTSQPSQGLTIDLLTGRHFVLGNREIGGRSFLGELYYAALYNRALGLATIGEHAARLSSDDDGS